jgi:hypothetical protein
MGKVYVDDTGARVYVSSFQDPDRGWRTYWGTCRGHKRLKLPELPLANLQVEAELNLEACARARGWPEFKTSSAASASPREKGF